MGAAAPAVRPLPPDLEAFLREPNPAVVGTLRADGSPHTVPTWYDWEDVDDAGLVDIDRLAIRYTGRPYRNRTSPRVSAWMRPERWNRW